MISVAIGVLFSGDNQDNQGEWLSQNLRLKVLRLILCFISQSDLNYRDHWWVISLTEDKLKPWLIVRLYWPPWELSIAIKSDRWCLRPKALKLEAKFNHWLHRRRINYFDLWFCFILWVICFWIPSHLTSIIWLLWLLCSNTWELSIDEWNQVLPISHS
jgi:hypothetical protein